jgi:hypothetical protein
MLDHKLSHDQFAKVLSEKEFWSKDLWKEVKATVRKIDDDNNVLIFDDTIIEKPYTDESDLICWHFDHKTNNSVKWVNLMTCLLHSEKSKMCVPLDFETVLKPEFSCEIETRKVKRKCPQTKNDMLRTMFDHALINQVKFTYALFDSWFCSNENLRHITKHWKHCISEIKVNRVIAFSHKDRSGQKFVAISQAQLEPWVVYHVFIKDYQNQVALVKQVFENKDWSTWERVLLCTDCALSYDQITSLYKRRWKIEESYKSMKCNTSLAKSPTKTIKTQTNHFFLSMVSYFRLELMSSTIELNHFALKTKLYITALKASYEDLQNLKSMYNITS